MTIAPEPPHGALGERGQPSSPHPESAMTGTSVAGARSSTPHPTTPTAHRSHKPHPDEDD